MLLTRELLEAVGPFDEDLEAFGEDVDLSLRARRRGFPLRYVPEARIEHALGRCIGRRGALAQRESGRPLVVDHDVRESATYIHTHPEHR